jgi:hypothetical protein
MTAIGIVDRIIAIHRELAAPSVPHAFGGALALAWCTRAARGTIDVDLNVFVPPDAARAALTALPAAIAWDDDDLEHVARDGQVRLWWDATPVDTFFSTTAFHDDAATRVRWEPLGGQDLPFLSCRDLAVFKAFYNRTQDWADLERMAEAGTLDVEPVLGVLVHYLGGGDQRVERLRQLG